MRDGWCRGDVPVSALLCLSALGVFWKGTWSWTYLLKTDRKLLCKIRAQHSQSIKPDLKMSNILLTWCSYCFTIFLNVWACFFQCGERRWRCQFYSVPEVAARLSECLPAAGLKLGQTSPWWSHYQPHISGLPSLPIDSRKHKQVFHSCENSLSFFLYRSRWRHGPRYVCRCGREAVREKCVVGPGCWRGRAVSLLEPPSS